MLSRHHQVALLDPATGRVLAVPGDDGLRLPRVEREWPGHRDLAAACGDPGAVLAALPTREADGTVTNVLTGDGSSTLEGGAWLPVDGAEGIDTLALTSGAAAAIRRTLAEQRDGVPDDGRADWFRPAWHDEVVEFVDRVATAQGFRRAGLPEPVRLWSLSAVLRIPVVRDGAAGDLWFKATCDGFHGEPALTAAVCRLEPDLMPRVLGVDAERAWMLMEPIPHADDETDPTHAPSVARALARLQLDTLPETDHLLAAGAPDRGLDATLTWLHTVLHDSVERDVMTAEQRGAAVEMEPWLVDQVRELWGLGLPDALSHGDLHLGNVAWGGEAPVFFDWTDLCVTHPYLDARTLARSAAQSGGEEALQAVWEAYAEPWRGAYPHVDHDRAWELAGTVERVFQAISYEQIYRAQPPSARWELATVVVGILNRLAGIHRDNHHVE
jgi:hypothetical protein